MTETPNLHLTKDAKTDKYSVERVNANSDKIDTFAGAALERLSALESALRQTAYTTPELHSNAQGNVTIESGGYVVLGSICILNCRIKTTAQLTGSGLFANLPLPIAAELTAGSSVVAAANPKGYGMTITNQRHMIFASSNLPIPADTVICISAVYLCQQGGGT